MHISDGVLSFPVLATGFLLAAGGTYLGIRTLKDRDIPKVGLMSAVLFSVSLVHVPIGPGAAHLTLGGLAGLLLGWSAFPALLIAFFLQLIFFGYGGFTTIGVITFNAAIPGVILSLILPKLLFLQGKKRQGLFFIAGFFSVFFSALLTAGSLSLSGKEFFTPALFLFSSHLPIMFVEGLICALCLSTIENIKPEILSWEVKLEIV